jgi:hypothetical protein
MQRQSWLLRRQSPLYVPGGGKAGELGVTRIKRLGLDVGAGDSRDARSDHVGLLG